MSGSRYALALALLAPSCGGKGASPQKATTHKATTHKATSTDVAECTPVLSTIDFAAAAAADTFETLAEIDLEKVETLARSLGIGSEVQYARWGPTGDLLVAISGCEEQECAAGVALIERNDDGFFVKKGDADLPSVLDVDVGLDHVFIANLIGDEHPEFWVVYTTFDEDEVRHQNAAAYTLSGLSLLWSKTLTAGDFCKASVHATDLECDDQGDLVLRRECSDAPMEEAHYHWINNRLRRATP